MSLPAVLRVVDIDRRSSARTTVQAVADIDHGGGDIDARVVDFSATGFRAVTREELRIGAWVKLKLSDVTAPEAQVRWRKNNEYGFRFAFPLQDEFVAEVAPTHAADIRMSWSDYQARRCRLGDEVVALSPLMAEIVAVLMIRRGELISGVDLARLIWPGQRAARKRMATLHVIITRLRQRLPAHILSPSRGSYMIAKPQG